MDREQLVLWLEERRANCINIARTKRDKRDRESWLEDACYFHAAIQAIDPEREIQTEPHHGS